jgi:hypothetical protein
VDSRLRGLSPEGSRPQGGNDMTFYGPVDSRLRGLSPEGSRPQGGNDAPWRDVVGVPQARDGCPTGGPKPSGGHKGRPYIVGTKREIICSRTLSERASTSPRVSVLVGIGG